MRAQGSIWSGLRLLAFGDVPLSLLLAEAPTAMWTRYAIIQLWRKCLLWRQVLQGAPFLLELRHDAGFLNCPAKSLRLDSPIGGKLVLSGWLDRSRSAIFTPLSSLCFLLQLQSLFWHSMFGSLELFPLFLEHLDTNLFMLHQGCLSKLSATMSAWHQTFVSHGFACRI